MNVCAYVWMCLCVNVCVLVYCNQPKLTGTHACVYIRVSVYAPV